MKIHKNYEDYIQNNKDVIAMIHLKALPATPLNKLSTKEIIDQALKEAKTYKKLGLKTVMIENMFDIPYTKKITPEIISIMSIIGYEIKKLGLYCGIQILAGGNIEAISVAKTANLDFIRAEGFVFSHIGDEGFFDSCAGELLRYRKKIDAENVLVFTDIKKKHSSHSITSDMSIEQTAHAAEFFLSDGIIITGNSTGEEPSINELKELNNINSQIIIGSGISSKNIGKYINLANIFIIGSSFKKKGYWKNELDEKEIELFLKRFDKIKKIE